MFIDSRYVVPHVVPMRGRRGSTSIYVMHNLHVSPPCRWDSEINLVYKRVLSRIDDMDAMVTLTERQREDIAERRGGGRATCSWSRTRSDAARRRRPRAAARPAPRRRSWRGWSRRSGSSDAIAAFEQVVAAVPERAAGHLRRRQPAGRAAGGDRAPRARRLASSCAASTREARDALWTSSAFLMTSSFEGYPLSTLESMSRGCPVVSYDIKYGPREQITDGVDGFLVPRATSTRLAQRVIELLRLARAGARG